MIRIRRAGETDLPAVIRLQHQLGPHEPPMSHDDAVAIFAVNSPEYAATFFACARIGAVLVPINLMFNADDVDYVLQKTRVKALLENYSRRFVNDFLASQPVPDRPTS